MYHVYRLIVVLVFGFVFMQNSFALFKHKHKKIFGCRYGKHYPKKGLVTTIRRNPPHQGKIVPRKRKYNNELLAGPVVNKILSTNNNKRSARENLIVERKSKRRKLENIYEYGGFVIYNEARPAGMTKAKVTEYLNALNQLACAIGDEFLKKCITDIRRERFDPNDNEVLTGQLRSCGLLGECNFFSLEFVRMLRNETKFPGIDYHISNCLSSLFSP